MNVIEGEKKIHPWWQVVMSLNVPFRKIKVMRENQNHESFIPSLFRIAKKKKIHPWQVVMSLNDSEKVRNSHDERILQRLKRDTFSSSVIMACGQIHPPWQHVALAAAHTYVVRARAQRSNKQDIPAWNLTWSFACYHVSQSAASDILHNDLFTRIKATMNFNQVESGCTMLIENIFIWSTRAGKSLRHPGLLLPITAPALIEKNDPGSEAVHAMLHAQRSQGTASTQTSRARENRPCIAQRACRHGKCHAGQSEELHFLVFRICSQDRRTDNKKLWPFLSSNDLGPCCLDSCPRGTAPPLCSGPRGHKPEGDSPHVFLRIALSSHRQDLFFASTTGT
jgi:hypothetical protein